MRDRGEALVARALERRAFALTAALPSLAGRTPLCELKVEAATEPQADGERVRVRAHLHMRLPGEHGGHQDLNSWVEVRASSASLDDESRALLPEKLQKLGLAPQPGKRVQTFAGALGRGFAVLTLLSLNKSQLPAALRAMLGGRPFQLSATAASVIDETR